MAKFLFFIAALATCAVCSVALGQEPGAGIRCGDTITVDTTLDRDLTGCGSNGLLIGADNITLDLNGHTISGDGKPVSRCPRRQQEICDFGVVNDGHDGVTVRNGSVGQFKVGVYVATARESRVLGISSSQNTFFGFVVFRSAQILVRGSSGSRNLAPQGDGMGLFLSHDVRIVDNEFRRNPEPGIHVQASTDILIKGNLITRSGIGISVGGDKPADRSDRNQIRGNRFVANGTGVMVSGNRNVIVRNRFSRVGDGIAIENARGNLVARNVILDARKSGIYLGLNDPPVGGADNVVRRNVVRRSGGDAFKVRSTDEHSLLIGNLASRSGDDGFAVRSSSTKLVGNRAVGNDALGIKAVFGVIDGGGNLASGNGDRRQCVNVRCR